MDEQIKRQWPIENTSLWPIDKLLPYARNPKTHPPEQVELIARSLARFGQTQAVLLDGDDGPTRGEIIAGHGRVLAAEKLGWTQLRAAEAHGWSDDEKRAYRIMDNELGSERLAPYDGELLRTELQALQGMGFDDMPLLGFDQTQLSSYLNPPLEPIAPPERELTPDEKPLMVEAWQKLAGEWLHIVEQQEQLSSNFTKGALLVHFLRARFFNAPIPSAATIAYTPHRALTAYRSGSLADGLRKAITNEQDFVERLWFVLGDVPKLDKLLGGTLPFLDHRIPAEFPVDLARSLYDEFAPDGARVLDPCHGWGGRMLGFLLAKNARHYHGFDTDPLTSRGVRHLFDDVRYYAAGKKTAKLENIAFEDSMLKSASYDFALTSPPYYDTEKYGGDETSWRRYQSFEQWVNGFFQPLIAKVGKALKHDAVFALQVGSQAYPLEATARQLAPTCGFDYVETRLTEMSEKGYVGLGTEGAVERDRESHEVVVLLKKKTRAE